MRREISREAWFAVKNFDHKFNDDENDPISFYRKRPVYAGDHPEKPSGHTDNHGDIPVSLLLTIASLHDSQAAIPLIQMSSERVTYLYDLADAAYDAPHI